MELSNHKARFVSYFYNLLVIIVKRLMHGAVHVTISYMDHVYFFKIKLALINMHISEKYYLLYIYQSLKQALDIWSTLFTNSKS